MISDDGPVMRFFILSLFLFSEELGLKVNSEARWDGSACLWLEQTQESWGLLLGQCVGLFEVVL